MRREAFDDRRSQVPPLRQRTPAGFDRLVRVQGKLPAGAPLPSWQVACPCRKTRARQPSGCRGGCFWSWERALAGQWATILPARFRQPIPPKSPCGKDWLPGWSTSLSICSLLLPIFRLPAAGFTCGDRGPCPGQGRFTDRDIDWLSFQRCLPEYPTMYLSVSNCQRVVCDTSNLRFVLGFSPRLNQSVSRSVSSAPPG